MKFTVGSCHFPVYIIQYTVYSSQLPVASCHKPNQTNSQLPVGSSQCLCVYSYSLKVASRVADEATSAMKLELQRKLVNVRLLSKAEAQLVQFSHSSDIALAVAVAVAVGVAVDDKSCTGSLLLNNNE